MAAARRQGRDLAFDGAVVGQREHRVGVAAAHALDEAAQGAPEQGGGPFQLALVALEGPPDC